MNFLRLIGLIATLVIFLCCAVPLQFLAQRRFPHLSARMTQNFAQLLLRILRIRIDCATRSERTGGRLLIANHISWIDILALASVESASFVGKSEIARWPLVSTFAKVERTIYIDRKRRRSIIPANRMMADCLASNRDVLLFPEGTTGAGNGLLKFHSSHFAAPGLALTAMPERESVPVQPILIRYSSATAAWIGDMSLIPHIWQVLREKPIVCELLYGPALDHQRDTNRKAMTQKARAIMECLLEAPEAETRHAATSRQIIQPGRPMLVAVQNSSHSPGMEREPAGSSWCGLSFEESAASLTACRADSESMRQFTGN